MKILVRRQGALGDVVLTTPVMRRLRQEHPDAEIAIQTAYGDVFRNSPHRLTVLPAGVLPHAWTPDGGVDRTIELDLAYERRPTIHVVRAYMEEAFGDQGDDFDLRQELFFGDPAPWPRSRPMVAVHAAKAGWRNRTLPDTMWREVVQRLRALGCFPIMVGSPRDALPGVTASTFHSTDILAQAAIIARCACFIGSDSGLLHIAGATNTPVVGLFTCVRPDCRMPIRNASDVAVVADIDCVGCLARAPAPTTFETCIRGDTACVQRFSAAHIADLVAGLL